MTIFFRQLIFVFSVVFMFVGSQATLAEANAAKTLDELLQLVKEGKAKDDQVNKKREAVFRQSKNKQVALLKKARNELKKQQNRSEQLEKRFDKNEITLQAKRKQLDERLGSMKELFGHLTATAGDMRTVFQNSIVSVQFPERDKPLTELIDKMSGSTQLPTIEEIEGLWYEIQREMTESGKVVKFTTTVIKPNGERKEQEVVRVGTYNLISEGSYLKYANNVVEELARQPAREFTAAADETQSATGGMTKLGIDPTGPSGGSLLAALIDTPNLTERWHQGGKVGYIITVVGLLAVIIAIWRLLALWLMGNKVNNQLNAAKANGDNPLGRVLSVHESNPTMDTETLELKLGEAILKEKPSIESGISLLKIISMVAPLMGLLGTVTGMIITFQAITIYGAGDPKAMAGGISGALVTTVLGLIVAIPTVLLHTIVNGRAKRILHIIEEQSMGIIAEHTDAQLRSVS